MQARNDQNPSRWSLTYPTYRLGIGIGVFALLAIATLSAAHDTLRASPAAGEALNVAMNLVPMVGATAGAYLARDRKMFHGVATGLLTLLPTLLIAVLLLGFILPLVVAPLLLSTLLATIPAFIGAALGTALSTLVSRVRRRH